MATIPTVVILDDHPAEQALLRYFLSQRGISSTALSPREGAARIAALAPDLVLLDEPTAHGAGTRLCKELKALLPGVRVVLLAAHEAQVRAAVPDLGGADAVLSKPLDFGALVRVIEPVLEPRPAKKRVLVVDDDVDVLNMTTRVLGAEGCSVTCVVEPKELLQRPPTEAFDLVLLDLRMPEIDGLDVCFFLRQHYGDDVRICIMTAAHDPASIRRAEAYGADGWIQKPCRAADLLALAGVPRRLPEPAPAAAAAAAAPQAAVVRPPRHVLVVDDDKDILEYCRAVLGGAGAVVDAIQDPSVLREQLPPGGAYDSVLLDIFMPVVDGIELLRRFSKDVKNAGSRLYIITAEEDPALRTLANRSGADGYLTKPLLPQSLLDLLAAA